MKNTILSISITFLFISCNQAVIIEEQSTSEITTEINQLMTQWHQDAADSDLEDYLALMHESSNYIGTDGNENWTKEEFRVFCQPHFDRKKTWNFKTLERNVYIVETKNTVWFEELLEGALGPCRGSGVLEKYDGQWKLKQYVLSMTVPNDDSGNVLNIKSKNDSIFLNQFNN